MTFFTGHYQLRLYIALLAAASLLSFSRAEAETEANQAIERLTLALQQKCSRYTEENIHNMIRAMDETSRGLMRVNIDILRYSECECIPDRLQSLGKEFRTGSNQPGWQASLQSRLKTISLACAAEGYKRHWLAFCRESMRSETDDRSQIETACQCMSQTVHSISNEELARLSLNALARYRQKTGHADDKDTEDSAGSPAERRFVSAFNACLDKAGIDPDSDYKKQYVLKMKEQTKARLARANLQVIASALDIYRLDYGKFPAQDKGLAALLQKPRKSVSGEERDPYLKKLPIDPWGNDYQYRLLDDGVRFELFSYGRDGRRGGSGPDRDIYYGN